MVLTMQSLLIYREIKVGSIVLQLEAMKYIILIQRQEKHKAGIMSRE